MLGREYLRVDQCFKFKGSCAGGCSRTIRSSKQGQTEELTGWLWIFGQLEKINNKSMKGGVQEKENMPQKQYIFFLNLS